MKNVLASKKMRSCNETKCVSPRIHFPKATLVSNWKRRNDSSNINSVFNYEYGKHSCIPAELEELRLEGKKKPVMGCNNCYCRQKGTKPMLNCRPKMCISKETVEDRNLRRSPFPNCNYEESADKTRHSVSNLNTTLATTIDTDEEFGYTEQRKTYNRYRGEDDKPAIATDAFDDQNLNKSVTTIYGTNKAATSQPTATSSYFTSKASAEDLKAFRNQHYFETHSVDKFEKEAPEHTCTFQFKLDDSLLLQPLNTDSYGKSRCIVCNVPMEQKQLEQHKSYFDDHTSDVKIRKAALRDKHGLVRRTIGITGEKMKTELKCTRADFDKLKNVFRRSQKLQYFNTFALRQQKMIC